MIHLYLFDGFIIQKKSFRDIVYDTIFSFSDIPALWHSRINFYINHLQNASSHSRNSSLDDKTDSVVTQPSKFGNFIYSSDHEKHAKQHSQKLVCYYTTPKYNLKRKREQLKSDKTLKIKDINPHLCTHILIGIVEISNCSLVIDEYLEEAFKESNLLKGKNDKLKVMLWVGGADESTGFSEMVSNHDNRKKFIQSLKENFEKFGLDGVGEFYFVY
jgi:GH18 family chitinase